MLALYILSLTISITVLVFCIHRREEQDLYFGLFAIAAIFANIGVLQLANALMKMPNRKGWGLMFAWMRLTILFMNFPLVLCAIDFYDACLIGTCDF